MIQQMIITQHWSRVAAAADAVGRANNSGFSCPLLVLYLSLALTFEAYSIQFYFCLSLLSQ